jgi:hypothetical protein
VGGFLLSCEHETIRAVYTELDAVGMFQPAALHTLAVDEYSVTAACIFDVVFALIAENPSVRSRCPIIPQDKMISGLPSD